MRTKQVKKLEPIDRFFYWIKERHDIYLRRKKGQEKPWTDDRVLQENFFTNPYRENDKTTVWFRENIRDPLYDDPKVVFATICFRWFNLPQPTGELLIKEGLIYEWNEKTALKSLKRLRDKNQKIFTGAFMIASPSKVPKYEGICKRITKVWKERQWILDQISADCSLENCQNTLIQFDGLGAFMAYEIVCDLRHTAILQDATDVDTWCNVGPGANRGLYRINDYELDKNHPSHLSDELEQINDLLKLARKKLKRIPKLELREIEHSLCEWDKYERCLWKQGKSKRKYDGGSE